MDDILKTGGKYGQKLTKQAVTQVRTLASEDKYRLKQEGFDLDLTYITARVIAMGVPADSIIAQAYRNHISTVSKYLEKMHGSNYMIFNVSEIHYDPARFNHQVKYMGWPDHHAPPLDHLFTLLDAIHIWLNVDKENVAVIHCKAGKGRTGTAIAAYLLYSSICSTATQALDTFANARSASGNGVTVPTQRRYVGYIEKIVSGRVSKQITLPPKKLILKQIIMSPVADVDILKGGWRPSIELAYSYQLECPFFVFSADRKYSKEKGYRSVMIDVNREIRGDVYVRVYHQQDLLVKKKKKKVLQFRAGFHTSFIRLDKCVFQCGVEGLDGASSGRLKDSHFPHNFSLRLTFDDPDHSFPLSHPSHHPPIPQRPPQYSPQQLSSNLSPSVPVHLNYSPSQAIELSPHLQQQQLQQQHLHLQQQHLHLQHQKQQLMHNMSPPHQQQYQQQLDFKPSKYGNRKKPLPPQPQQQQQTNYVTNNRVKSNPLPGEHHSSHIHHLHLSQPPPDPHLHFSQYFPSPNLLQHPLPQHHTHPQPLGQQPQEQEGWEGKERGRSSTMPGSMVHFPTPLSSCFSSLHPPFLP